MQNQNKFVGNSQSFPPPPPFQLNFRHCICVANIHYFGITRRKVTPTKLQATRSKLTLSFN